MQENSFKQATKNYIQKIEDAFQEWITLHPNGGIFHYKDVHLSVKPKKEIQRKETAGSIRVRNSE